MGLNRRGNSNGSRGQVMPNPNFAKKRPRENGKGGGKGGAGKAVHNRSGAGKSFGKGGADNRPQRFKRRGGGGAFRPDGPIAKREGGRKGGGGREGGRKGGGGKGVQGPKKHILKDKAQPGKVLGRFGRKVASAKGFAGGASGKGAGRRGRNDAGHFRGRNDGFGKGAGKSGGGRWVFIPSGAAGKHVMQSQVLKQAVAHSSHEGRWQPPKYPKSELGSALALLLGRDPTKDDCVYDMGEERGKKIATLTIAALTTERKEFKGKPASDEREAQNNAAQKALNCLSKEIQSAREARAAAKAEKIAEKRAAHKEKREAERAEKESTKD